MNFDGHILIPWFMLCVCHLEIQAAACLACAFFRNYPGHLCRRQTSGAYGLHRWLRKVGTSMLCIQGLESEGKDTELQFKSIPQMQSRLTDWNKGSPKRLWEDGHWLGILFHVQGSEMSRSSQLESRLNAFSKGLCRLASKDSARGNAQRDKPLERSIQSHERQGLQDDSTHQSFDLEWKGR